MASEDTYPAVQSVLARWSHLLDDREYQKMADLLVPDAVMQFPSGVEFVGRDAIRDAVAKVQPERPIKHLTGIPDVEFRGASVAVARTDMVSFVVEPDGTWRVGVATRYHDRLRLIDGRWMFEVRQMRAAGAPAVSVRDL
jgi:uncharacterized protein (TIGR02246 family)